MRYAQAMVDDPVDTSVAFDPRAGVELAEDELAGLAKRCIVEGLLAGDRLVPHPPGLRPERFLREHRDVTFYDAQMLAGSLADHERARELDAMPEELLTDDIGELQLSNRLNAAERPQVGRADGSVRRRAP